MDRSFLQAVVRLYQEYCNLVEEENRSGIQEIIDFLWFLQSPFSSQMDRSQIFNVLQLMWGCNWEENEKLQEAMNCVNKKIFGMVSPQIKTDQPSYPQEASSEPLHIENKEEIPLPSHSITTTSNISSIKPQPGYRLVPPRVLSEKKLGKIWKYVRNGAKTRFTQELDIYRMINLRSLRTVWVAQYQTTRNLRIEVLLLYDKSPTLTPYHRQITEVIQSLKWDSKFHITTQRFLPSHIDWLKWKNIILETRKTIDRHLTLLFTDGVSKGWISEVAENFFLQLSGLTELIWLNPYPQWLWDTTILGCCRQPVKQDTNVSKNFGVISCDEDGLSEIGNSVQERCYSQFTYKRLDFDVQDEVDKRRKKASQDVLQWAQSAISRHSPETFSLLCLACILPVFDADLIHLLREPFTCGAKLYHEAMFYTSGLVTQESQAEGIFKLKSEAREPIWESDAFHNDFPPERKKKIYKYIREYVEERYTSQESAWESQWKLCQAVANSTPLPSSVLQKQNDDFGYLLEKLIEEEVISIEEEVISEKELTPLELELTSELSKESEKGIEPRKIADQIIIRLGNMFDESCDLIVIPCSTGGTVSKFISKELILHNIPTPRHSNELGSIDFLTLEENKIAKFVCYAFSVDNHTSSLTAINLIGKRLGKLTINKDSIKKISCSLLGTGAGKLDEIESLQSLIDGFLSSSSENSTLTVNILNNNIFNRAAELLEKKEAEFQYIKLRKGIEFFVNTRGKLSEIRFSLPYLGKLDGKIGIGESQQIVFSVYGSPHKTVFMDDLQGKSEDKESEVLYYNQHSSKILYKDQGLLFWFDENQKVSQFVVAKYWALIHGNFNIIAPNEFNVETRGLVAPSNTIFFRIPIFDWNDIEIECVVTVIKDKNANLPPECNFVLQGDGANRISGYFIWIWCGGIKIAKCPEEWEKQNGKYVFDANSKVRLYNNKQSRILITKKKNIIQVYINGILGYHYIDRNISNLQIPGFVGLDVWGYEKGSCIIKEFQIKEKGRLTYPLPTLKLVIIHIHPDFAPELSKLLKEWNSTQNKIKFIELKLNPKWDSVFLNLKWESIFLKEGEISVNKASNLASKVRKVYGYTKDVTILIFTEKILYDNNYSQLFVGGSIEKQTAIISLAFLRKIYKNDKSLIFPGMVSHILYSLAIDCGVKAHEDTQGCIMDFCNNTEDINLRLQQGIHFCDECISKLSKTEYSFLTTTLAVFIPPETLDFIWSRTKIYRCESIDEIEHLHQLLLNDLEERLNKMPLQNFDWLHLLKEGNKILFMVKEIINKSKNIPSKQQMTSLIDNPIEIQISLIDENRIFIFHDWPSCMGHYASCIGSDATDIIDQVFQYPNGAIIWFDRRSNEITKNVTSDYLRLNTAFFSSLENNWKIFVEMHQEINNPNGAFRLINAFSITFLLRKFDDMLIKLSTFVFQYRQDWSKKRVDLSLIQWILTLFSEQRNILEPRFTQGTYTKIVGILKEINNIRNNLIFSQPEPNIAAIKKLQYLINLSFPLLGKALISIFIDTFDYGTLNQKKTMTDIISEIDEILPEIIGMFIKDLIDEEDSYVRDTAHRFLLQLGLKAIPALSAALSDKNPILRKKVVKVIGEMGLQAESVIPILADLIANDPDELVRKEAEKEKKLASSTAKETDIKRGNGNTIWNRNRIEQIIPKSVWLVKIEYDNGIGSGIIVSKNGHILTCYHNTFTSAGIPRTIQKVIRMETIPGDPNFAIWGNPIPGVEENIKLIPPREDWQFAKTNELSALLVSEESFRNIEPPIIEQRPLKIGEPVSILAYDEKNERNYRILDCKVLDLFYSESPQIRLPTSGYPSMSGGGVFTSKGKLVGIIHHIDPERHNEIIASPLFYTKIEEWIPRLVISKKKQNPSNRACQSFNPQDIANLAQSCIDNFLTKETADYALLKIGINPASIPNSPHTLTYYINMIQFLVSHGQLENWLAKLSKEGFKFAQEWIERVSK